MLGSDIGSERHDSNALPIDSVIILRGLCCPIRCVDGQKAFRQSQLFELLTLGNCLPCKSGKIGIEINHLPERRVRPNDDRLLGLQTGDWNGSRTENDIMVDQLQTAFQLSSETANHQGIAV